MSTLTDFTHDHRKRETVKKELMQLGVHPSVHVAEVFSSPGNVRFFFFPKGLVSPLD